MEAMDSSFFLISGGLGGATLSTSSLNIINADLEHSTSPLGYDPFDAFLSHSCSLDHNHHHSQHGHLHQAESSNQSPASSSASSSMSGSCLGLNYMDDYFGDRCGSPISLINQYPSLDQLDQPMMAASPGLLAADLLGARKTLAGQPNHHHLQHNSPFIQQTDPTVCEDNDLNGTLTSFVVGDLGADSDAGYHSGAADLFSSMSSSIDCGLGPSNINGASSDLAEAYYFRLGLEQPTGGHSSSSNNNNNCDHHHHLSHHNHNHHHHQHNHLNNHHNTYSVGGSCSSLSGYTSDNNTTISNSSQTTTYSDIINNNHDYISYNDPFGHFDSSLYSSQGDRSGQQVAGSGSTSSNNNNNNKTPKRSVLMNLLIDGADIGAGYTCVNNRRPLVQYNHH